VAFLWTRISFERARRVKGPRALDLAILFLFSSGLSAKIRDMVHTMSGEIGDTTYGVTLNLDVLTHH